MNRDPWVLDGAPWNGYGGVAPTGPVSGTSHVYTWTNAALSASIYLPETGIQVPSVDSENWDVGGKEHLGAWIHD
jgi:hypothetical protein